MIQRATARYVGAVLVVTLCGALLRWETLGAGFFADDYGQLAMLEGRYPLPRSPLDLFTFSDGSLAEGRRLIDSGFYPWFADPELRLSMLRPLASASLWLDHALFGRAAVAYHVHGVLWWCALSGALAFLYRRVVPTAVALLALGLFAADEAHTVILAWIANRCALASTTLAVLALALYVASAGAEAEPSRRARWACAGLFSLALGFGEYATCVLGYFLAYEATCGAGALRARLWRLMPALAPAGVYIAVRAALGYTPRHSGMYADPFAEPLRFLALSATRVPVLAADLLLALRSDAWTFGGESGPLALLGGRLLPAGSLERGEAQRALQVGLGVVACGLFALLARFLWTRSRLVHLRWLSLGSALSLVPVIGSFPSSRLLIVPLIGFCPALAGLICEGLGRVHTLLRQRPARRRAGALGLAVVAVASCALHFSLPIWTTRRAMASLEDRGARRLRAVLELADDGGLARRDLVLLNAADGDASMYLPIVRALHGRAPPRACYTLSLVPAPYALLRVAEDAFTMDFRRPAAMLRTAGELLLRSPARPLERGRVLETPRFSVTVSSAADGHPQRLLVRFDGPLERDDLRFMLTTREGIRRFALPPVGRAVEVPAPVLPD